jgi:hypothetical protein
VAYDLAVLLFVAAFVAAVVWIFVVARGHRVTVLGALAAVWLLDVAAISQGWHDLDGFIDCNDSCSPGQTAAGVVVLWVPVLFVVLLIALLVLAVRRRMRA